MKILILTCLYVFFPMLIIYAYQRFSFLRKIGTVILAYTTGILMSLSGFMDCEAADLESVTKMQTILQNICVPLAIPLMLFSSNIKLWVKTLYQTFIAFFTGIFAIVSTVILAYFVFRNMHIQELSKAAGLMVGFYTGGTPNVAALNMALQPSPETFMLVNSFEIIVTFCFLAFIIFGGYKLIRKILPYQTKERRIGNLQTSAESFEDYSHILSKKSRRSLLPPLLLSILIFGLGVGLSLVFPKNYQIVVIVLTITTLAILSTGIDKIRN
ncbi:MAG: DUF819 family protein, partial [Bacteroidales bacterium]